MRVTYDKDIIALVDDQGTVVHHFVRNDPEFNIGLMGVISSDPHLLEMYNTLVLASQLTKVAIFARAAENSMGDVRAILNNAAFNDTTAAVLKARLH